MGDGEYRRSAGRARAVLTIFGRGSACPRPGGCRITEGAHEREGHPMSTATAQPVTYGLDASIPTWSVARYQRMIEAGILTAEDRVELLENHVVLKMPRNPPHDGTLDLVKAVLPGLLPPGWLLRMQQTVVL